VIALFRAAVIAVLIFAFVPSGARAAASMGTTSPSAGACSYDRSSPNPHSAPTTALPNVLIGASAGSSSRHQPKRAGIAGLLAAENEAAIFARLEQVKTAEGADVAAQLDLGGGKFVGTNLARDNARPHPGTFRFFVEEAEGDAFAQAIATGEDFSSESGTLSVTKKPCGFCKSSISATARSLGLDRLVASHSGREYLKTTSL
jgi:hypothetical protein